MTHSMAAVLSSIALAAGTALAVTPGPQAALPSPPAVPLVLSDSLVSRKQEFSDTIARAVERVRAFAKRYGWGHLATEGFMDRVMVFDRKSSFDRTLLTMAGMDPAAPLPATYCAALENRVLVAVAPELYARAYPDGVEEASYEKLLAHEIAHRLHVRVLDGNEEAMGPIWFYEGFALFAADQLRTAKVVLSDDEIWRIVADPERGSYARYAFVFRHFAARASLPALVQKAGEPGFVDWLHTLGPPARS